MTDIVERLRADAVAFRGNPDVVGPCVTLLVEEAADEIERLRAAIAWIEPPFVDDHTPAQELRQRVSYCVADAKRADLQQEKSDD